MDDKDALRAGDLVVLVGETGVAGEGNGAQPGAQANGAGQAQPAVASA
jgi:hypothetical protein